MGAMAASCVNLVLNFIRFLHKKFKELTKKKKGKGNKIVKTLYLS